MKEDRYLSPENASSFWTWTRGLETVAWWEGSTIAFHEEIEVALRSQSRYGLPLFSEIVLVLSACRSNWNDPGGGKTLFADYLQSLNTDPFDALDEGVFADWLERLLKGLDCVHHLYCEKPTLESKLTILEIIFEDDGHFFTAPEAQAVAERLRNGPPFKLFYDPEVAASLSSRVPSMEFVKTIRNLLEVLPRIQEIESLTLREETGLDHLPEPIEGILEELSDAEAVRTLISDLREDDDSELVGLAEIARDLLGVLQVPRDLADPEDIPTGGFSDLANKGDLDRLLLTELAQDDEVLAVRVALNEALYLRRESPPKNPPKKRHIMIDNGIRLWGIPRAFAHAAALALAGNAGASDSVEVLSTEVDYELDELVSLLEADFRNRDGLAEALSRLDPSLQPGDVVKEFVNRSLKENSPAGDHILITHPLILEDPDFQKLTREIGGKAPLFIVTVDGSGELRFLVRSQNGERELQKIRIDVSKLAGDGKENHLRPEKIRSSWDPSLPRILSYNQIPLLQAHPIIEKRHWVSEDSDVVTLTRKGLLYHYNRSDRGAVLVRDDFVVKGACLFCAFDDRWVIWGFGKSISPKILAVDLDTGDFFNFTTFLNSPALYGLYVDGHAVLFTKHEAIGIASPGGDETERVAMEEKLQGVSGRFVKKGGSWYAVSVGSGITFTRIEIDRERDIVGIFDSPGKLGPLILMNDGRVLEFDGNQNPLVEFTEEERHPVHCILQIQEGGRRVLYRSRSLESCVVELDFGKQSSKVIRRGVQSLEPAASAIGSRIPSLRKNIAGIRILEHSRIELISKKGARGIPIWLKGNCLVLEGDESSEAGETLWFKKVKGVSEAYDLSKIDLPNGNAVFMDSRGMLHLKSVSPHTPEITFILKDQGMLSGWLSTGEFFGQSYFTGDHPTIPARDVYQHLQTFLWENLSV